MKWAGAALTLMASALHAGIIPTGAEISLRLTTKVSTGSAAAGAAGASGSTGSTQKVGSKIQAVVIAPVVVDGAISLPSGAQVTGIVKQIKAASDSERAELEIAFTRIDDGTYHADISAQVSSIENARELVDEKGIIRGIDGSQTYSSRIDQGLGKLEGNDRLAGLASILEAARQTLKIEHSDANIDYDVGSELNITLTAPLTWKGPLNGPESRLQSFPNQSALSTLVNRQPFRTFAEKPPRPSDMTNIMFIGTALELRQAFEKAGWSVPTQLDSKSKLETARALIEARGYKEGPMSVLTLEGQPPSMSFQKGNNTFGKRHHLRIFLRPDVFAGKQVWVCSSTHDINIDFSDRDRTFIHKVDTQIDRERAKVVNDLIFTGAVRAVALVDRPDVPTSIANATGDELQTDGSMAVLLLQ
jgi:hypothetical protein